MTIDFSDQHPDPDGRDLHKDFPRGVGGVLRGSPPMAQFMPTSLIRTTPSLQYRPGAYLLGAIDGEVNEDRSPDGRLRRWITGGRPIGVVTDKHIVTIAPTRSDKGRACVNTNALVTPARW